MSDDEAMDPSEEELAEAAALAQALEGKRAGDALPEEAAEAAALLRYAGREGELEGARAEQLLDELLAAGLPERTHAKRPARRFWGAGLLAALSAAAVVALMLRAGDRAEPSSAPRAERRMPAESAPLPSPSPSLLSAQSAASKDGAGRAALDSEMARYRETLLRDLEARYPAVVGALTQPRGGER